VGHRDRVGDRQPEAEALLAGFAPAILGEPLERP
jgi:hypothetical protein